VFGGFLLKKGQDTLWSNSKEIKIGIALHPFKAAVNISNVTSRGGFTIN
jgi:hypothetical protein